MDIRTLLEDQLLIFFVVGCIEVTSVTQKFVEEITSSVFLGETFTPNCAEIIMLCSGL